MSTPVKTRPDDIPEIVRLVSEFTASLDNQVDDSLSLLASWWINPYQSITTKIDTLIDEINTLQQAGRYVDINWIRELDYYKDLQHQIEESSNWFLDEAQILTDREMQSVANQAYLQTIDELATIGMYNRIPVEEFAALAASISKTGSPLRELLQGLGTENRLAVGKALEAGLVMGTPLNEIAWNMKNVSNLTYNRAAVISRTEILRAHRLATLDSYQKSGVIWYKRLANKRTACMACLLLDGETFPANMAFQDHPNGACAMVPVPHDYRSAAVWKTGGKYFQELSPDEQRARMGSNYYDAWKRKEFKLKDMVGWVKNSQWGASPAIMPLWKLQGYKSYAEKLQAGTGLKKTRKKVSSRQTKKAITSNEKNLFKKLGLFADQATLNNLKAGGLREGTDDGISYLNQHVRYKTDKLPAEGVIRFGQISGESYNAAFYPSTNMILYNVDRVAGNYPAILNDCLHEYGHFFDSKVLGNYAIDFEKGSWVEKGSYWSSTDEAKELMRELRRSSAYQKLEKTYKYSIPDYWDYASSDKELFARSFSQWVASKGDSFYAYKNIYKGYDLTSGYQWAEDDFAPIAEIFDRLFGG